MAKHRSKCFNDDLKCHIYCFWIHMQAYNVFFTYVIHRHPLYLRCERYFVYLAIISLIVNSVRRNIRNSTHGKTIPSLYFLAGSKFRIFLSWKVHTGHCCGKVADRFVLNEFGLWLFEDILYSWFLFSDYPNLFQCCVKRSCTEAIDEENFLTLIASDHEPK